MFTLDEMQVKRDYEERLQRAEHARLVRRTMAQKADDQGGFLEKLGKLALLSRGIRVLGSWERIRENSLSPSR